MIAPPAPATATPDPSMMAQYAMAQQALQSSLATPPSDNPDNGDAMLARYRPKPSMKPQPQSQQGPMAQAIQQARIAHPQAVAQQQNPNIPDGQSQQQQAANQMGQSHVANQIPGSTTLIRGGEVSHVFNQPQTQTQDPGEQWVTSGHVEGQQGLTDAQLGQRRAYNKIFSSMDPKQADTARAIVDAGGNLDHVMKWMDMQAGVASKQSLASERTAKQNRDDAQANIEYNTYGPGGLKGHEADERNQMEQQRLNDTDTRAAQGRVSHLQSQLANAHGTAKQAIQDEITQAQADAKGGGGHANVAGGGQYTRETDAQINAQPDAQAELQYRQQVAQLPQGQGKKLDMNDPAQKALALRMFQMVNQDPNKAQKLAEDAGWDVSK